MQILVVSVLLLNEACTAHLPLFSFSPDENKKYLMPWLETLYPEIEAAAFYSVSTVYINAFLAEALDDKWEIVNTINFLLKEA